ncbi:MAG: hypothetical protein M1828_007095 [Chrysothrix sp. TS-e1954]|nr:MAG: hypothetical protein M1828_007095 [Chrysothrix sp. TS-e1954]
MSAKSTGAQPTPNGNSSHRTHNDGSSERAFTTEQKDAVIRVRRCSPTGFYDILGLESEKTTVTDAGIKKAYRKLSLLTHPDKNGYKGADEAFKTSSRTQCLKRPALPQHSTDKKTNPVVSRAFQILSDPDKRTRYDTHGGDPDNRFSSSGGPSNPFTASSPFSNFASSASRGARGGGPMFEEEISPEELFRQFFGGGGMGGGFGGGGPGFVFNLGGGPGVRIHQFGGGRPRRRPPQQGEQGQRQGQQEQPTAASALYNLLPLLIFFVLPLLSSLFSGIDLGSSSRLPGFSLDTPSPPLTHLHNSARLGIPYFVNPTEIKELNSKRWQELDRAAENRLVGHLNAQCEREQMERQRLLQEAQGWFSVDHAKLDEAERLELKGCRRLRGLQRGWG